VGYVRATYCERPLSDIFEDIETYAHRSADYGEFGMRGVFLDETVNLYSADTKQYLDAIDQKVKGTGGVGGDKIVSSLDLCERSC
jgi:hypothetical protein